MRSLLTCLILISAGAAYGDASIGLFSDAACTSCNLNIPGPPWSGVVYIAAAGQVAPGPCTEGFIGASFRIVGLPASWLRAFAPSALAYAVVGDPLGDGVEIGFTELQLGRCVPLGTLTVWPSYPGAQATLHIEQHMAPPSGYQCPTVATNPNCPAGYIYCAGAGTLFINESGECLVAVEQTSWGAMKRLYE